MVGLSAIRTGHIYPQEILLVLISVRGWVDPRAIVRSERLCQCKQILYTFLFPPVVHTNIQAGRWIFLISPVQFICYRRYKPVSFLSCSSFVFQNALSCYVGPVAQSVQRLATVWTVRGSNAGGDEIFRTSPHQPWGPPSLLYNGYRVFPGGKERSWRDADPSPLLVPLSWNRRAIPLLPLWAVRPVQSLSACTRVTFTFTFYAAMQSWW